MNPQRVRNGVEVGRIKVWGGSHLEICKEFFPFLIFEYTGIAKLMKYHDCFVNGHKPKAHPRDAQITFLTEESPVWMHSLLGLVAQTLQGSAYSA